MLRRKKQPSTATPKELEKRIKKIISSLSEGWLAEERETGILFDHNAKVVYLETSYPATAHRWFSNLWGDPNIKWDDRASTLKLTVPISYCRRADLILRAEKRTYKK